MRNPTGVVRRPTGAGFTLVELLLTVSLLLLLAAAVVFNFGSLQRGMSLEEGAPLLESLFRYVRAQAASTGRTLRVVFEADSNSSLGGGAGTNAPSAGSSAGTTDRSEGIRILWEPDPFGAPGQYAVLREADSFIERLNELVEVRAVRSLNSVRTNVAGIGTNTPVGTPALNSAGRIDEAADALDGGNAIGRPPILFYADGSSDSVEVWLASREPEDHRQLVLSLSGLVGTTRRRWVSVSTDGMLETDADDKEKDRDRDRDKDNPEPESK